MSLMQSLDANGRNSQIQSLWGIYSRMNTKMIQIFTEVIICKSEILNLNILPHFHSHQSATWETSCRERKKREKGLHLRLHCQASFYLMIQNSIFHPHVLQSRESHVKKSSSDKHLTCNAVQGCQCHESCWSNCSLLENLLFSTVLIAKCIAFVISQPFYSGKSWHHLWATTYPTQLHS